MKRLKIPLIAGIFMMLFCACSKESDENITHLDEIPKDKNAFYIDGTEYKLAKGIVEYWGRDRQDDGYQFFVALLSSGLHYDGENASGYGDYMDIDVYCPNWDSLKSGTYTYSSSDRSAGCFRGSVALGFDVQTWMPQSVYEIVSGTLTINKTGSLYEILFECQADRFNIEDERTMSKNHQILAYYTGDLLEIDFVTEDPETCHFNTDTIDFTFGIDYADPQKYVAAGQQSDLSNTNLEEVRAVIGKPQNTVQGIIKVCDWVNQNFTFSDAGGAMIGKVTVDELFAIKKFYGCHSHALIIASVLRGFGFPVVMIETADVQWAYDFYDGTADYFKGHVLNEVYVENNWILFDNNCTYVENYDYSNPYISVIDPRDKGLFVFAKGLDTWDYSSGEENFTHEKMVDISDNIYCYEELFYTVKYLWNN